MFRYLSGKHFSLISFSDVDSNKKSILSLRLELHKGHLSVGGRISIFMSVKLRSTYPEWNQNVSQMFINNKVKIRFKQNIKFTNSGRSESVTGRYLIMPALF